MSFRRRSTGHPVQFDGLNPIAAGGEARILTLDGQPDLLAKIYRRPSAEREQKLEAMIAYARDDAASNLDHVSVAWPIDILETRDRNARVIGFLMHRAENTRPLIDYFNPMSRRKVCPLFNYLYLHRAARNLAASVRSVHARGYVIGDLNESNALVTETALVTLVDSDSFQVRESMSGTVYPCTVGRPEYTPAELQGKTYRETTLRAEHDLFGLAVLIFQILMEGTHPFAGIYAGAGDPPSYEERIAGGFYTYDPGQYTYQPMPTAPPIEVLTPKLRAMFERCFVDGHQYPSARLDAVAWAEALLEAEQSLTICEINSQHRYGGHLRRCPWCERSQQFCGRDPFPSLMAVQNGEVDMVYPASSEGAIAADLEVEYAVIDAGRLDAAGELIDDRSRDPWREVGRLRGFARVMLTAAICSGGIALLLALLYGGMVQSARNRLRTEIYESAMDLRYGSADLEALRRAGIGAAEAPGLIRSKLRHARSSVQHAINALKLDPLNSQAADAERTSRQFLRLAIADTEALEARLLVDRANDAIERAKTGEDGAADEQSWQTSIQQALEHTDRALNRDPKSEAAWIERVRALMFSDVNRARYEVRRAQMEVPGSTALEEMQKSL